MTLKDLLRNTAIVGIGAKLIFGAPDFSIQNSYAEEQVQEETSKEETNSAKKDINDILSGYKDVLMKGTLYTIEKSSINEKDLVIVSQEVAGTAPVSIKTNDKAVMEYLNNFINKPFVYKR